MIDKAIDSSCGNKDKSLLQRSDELCNTDIELRSFIRKRRYLQRSDDVEKSHSPPSAPHFDDRTQMHHRSNPITDANLYEPGFVPDETCTERQYSKASFQTEFPHHIHLDRGARNVSAGGYWLIRGYLFTHQGGRYLFPCPEHCDKSINPPFKPREKDR